MKKVTLAQVAKKAGVSLSTTSRVLNQSDKNMPIKISEKTKSKVRKAASELGYSNNLAASFMRTSSSKIIGIIVRDIQDPFLAKLTAKVECYLINQGFSVLIGNTNQEYKQVSSQINFMITNFFDGIVIIDNVPPKSDLIQLLKKNTTPYIALTGSFDQQITPVVRTNDFVGLQKLIHYLQKKHHTKIAFIGRSQRGVAHRRKMVQKILNREGLIVNKHWFINDNSDNQLIESLKKLTHLDERPSAIICAEDVIAEKVIGILTES